MLGIVELEELEESLKEELEERLTEILSRLNRTAQLEYFLDLLGMTELLHPDNGYHVPKSGNIVVIGESLVKAEILLAVARNLGIDKSRFELYLDYNKAKTFKFEKLQYNLTYSLIMVGPMPHSGIEKGDASSVISAIEKKNGYPPVVRLGAKGLKITKTDFEVKLKEAIDSGKIVA